MGTRYNVEDTEEHGQAGADPLYIRAAQAPSCPKLCQGRLEGASQHCPLEASGSRPPPLSGKELLAGDILPWSAPRGEGGPPTKATRDCESREGAQ